MATLFLAGGGDAEQSIQIDYAFQHKILASKKRRLLYIPIALRGNKLYNGCVDWFQNIFSPEIFSIVVWKDLTGKTFEDLMEFDGIYIGGGNTFNLLNELKKNSFDLFLQKYLESGGVIYGGSAGAIIFGKSILTTYDVNPFSSLESSFFDGFNLLSDFSVWPHYTVEQKEDVFRYLEEHNGPVIAIPEEAGIVFSDGEIQVYGSTNVFFFFRSKTAIELAPGKVFSLNDLS